jgi:uncharacterized protein YciI
MLYVIDCTDKTGHLQTRLDNREAHLSYLAGFSEQLLMAGPFLSEAGDMIGSMLIMEFATLQDAESFSANDPYQLAGLFSEVAIRPWRKTLPA